MDLGKTFWAKLEGEYLDRRPREYANVYAVKTTNDIGRSDRLLPPLRSN